MWREILIETIMKERQIKDRKLAEERARQIEAYMESQGLCGHYEGLRRNFVREYAAKDLIKRYFSN